MSMILSDRDKIYKKSFHHRNESRELDVFEAAHYFSGYNEAQKILMRENHRHQAWTCGRISLDVQQLPQHHANAMITSQKQNHKPFEKHNLKEKKYKQPNSPGRRLASFLNSLFSQSGSKKKKSKSTTQSMKDEEESPRGRRKRRSSISHFRSSSATAIDTSGFRTPPPYSHTTTKSLYKDFKSHPDQKQVESLSKHNGGQILLKPTTLDHHHDKFKFNNNTYDEKQRTSNWVGRYSSEDREFRKFNEIDDGAESDSSSDLFELQNYDLGIYSSGLPVYETTHMDSIKRGAPISIGAL